MSAFIRIDTCDDCIDSVREHYRQSKVTDVLCAYKCQTKEGHDYPYFNQDGTYDSSKVTLIHTVPLGEFLTIDVPEWCPRRK